MQTLSIHILSFFLLIITQVSLGLESNAALPADHAQRMTLALASFQKEIAPLLKEHCLKCHGGEKTKGDFDLTTREDMLRGGKEGVAVIPFNAKESSMMKLIRHEEDPAMPDKKPKLPDEVIATISAWIDNGAPYSEALIAGKTPKKDKSLVTEEDKQWWAFRDLQFIKTQDKKVNIIDAMLREKAKGTGLTFNPPADARALIRRMTLDLTGVPPTPEEIDTFLQSSSSNPQAAKENLIDRLLNSPRYGERWARHWLDVARFAESSGFEHDYDRPFAFHYRDFVIKALNMNMPYDQFVRWQLAGDEFEPRNGLAMAATGFLGAGVYPTQITANEVERVRYDALDDMLATTGNAMLGMTIGCARCHDHKYDPIPTKDYYRMLSTFTTTVRSNVEIELDPEKTKPLKSIWETELKHRKEALKSREEALNQPYKQWLAGGMADAGQAYWRLLEPTELESSSKATFKPLGDGSYLVEGENGALDTYTITATTKQRQVTGLKLEALTHPSMKRNGPGRAPNGNFGLAKIEITATPVQGGESKVITISKAIADYEQNKTHLSVASTLDNDSSSGWAVDGQIGKDHAAIFIFDQPMDFAEGAKLTIKLSFSVNTQHNIGRPRFSLISQVEPTLAGGVLAAKVGKAMQTVREGGVDKLQEKDRLALFDWWKQRDADWQEANSALADHKSKEPRSMTTVMICGEGYTPIRMNTQGGDFLNETHLLKRGNTELKDGVVTQGFMQVLMRQADEKKWAYQPPDGAKFSGRRRSLSNWITDVDHGSGALLARVIVNRLWQHHFGRGIVSTPNDFGKQGTLPSQPELLDWLAGELIRGGWKLKPIHKLIMMSAAYQQNSALDTAKEYRDPANDLFMRRTPLRLEAESIRDAMLFVSGQMDETMFGPGTRDEASKRRSIYFNIKRSQLIGSMVAFDAPEPLVSQGARPTTTVAPQALMMMNSPVVRSWAEAMSKKISTESKDTVSTIEKAYQICFGRSPSVDESREATAFMMQQREAYAAEKKPDEASLAFADYCQVLFGLNEFVYQP